MTSWTSPNQAFDEAVESFARSVLGDREILDEIAAFSDRIAPGVRATVLGQKLVQLTMPGVPDVYQAPRSSTFPWSTRTTGVRSTTPTGSGCSRRSSRATSKASPPRNVWTRRSSW